MNIRKYLLIQALALISALNCMAQLNGNGFYRFRNSAKTTDYICLANDKFNYTTIISTAGGGLKEFLLNQTAAVSRATACATIYLQTDIHLAQDANCIDPSTVVYADNTTGNYYDLIGQGTSLLSLTTGQYPGTTKLYFEDITALLTKVSGSGANSLYTARVSLKASNFSLADLGNRYFIDDEGKFNISESNSAQEAKWYIEPVDHFNVQPEVPYQGKYYTTIYVPFAFTLSTGVEKAYVVSAIGDDNTLEIEEFANGETVPAGTPVILECSTNNVTNCQLIPIGKPLSSTPYLTTSNAPTASTATNYEGTNLLKGTYFCNQDGKKTYTTKSGTATLNVSQITAPTNPQKYVLGLTASGKLGFVKATGTAMPANKAWIEYTGTAELVLPIENATLKGDVNGDGEVNVSDVTTLVDYILRKDPSPCVESACDVNEDGNVNVGDVTSLVDIILKKN